MNNENLLICIVVSFNRYRLNSILLLLLPERDVILTNIRDRISSIDNEIVRLGGSALVSSNTTESCKHAMPSVAPFPSIKKPRGRPCKKSDCEVIDTVKDSSTEKKERGRPPKKQENEVANTDPKPVEAMSPLTSVATSLISLKTGDLDPNVAMYKANASEAQVDTMVAANLTAVGDDANEQRDWLCQCGSMIEKKKVRCGQCRRWKDGKRKTRWSFKDKENKGGNKKSKSGAKKLGRPFKTAKSVYSKLSEADLALQANETVESVLGNMVTAVCEVGVEKKKRKKSSDEKQRKPKRSRSNDCTDQERKASLVTLDEAPPFESLMQAVAMQINNGQEQMTFSC